MELSDYNISQGDFQGDLEESYRIFRDIAEKLQCDGQKIVEKDAQIQYQEKTIKELIMEIHQLKEVAVHNRFYKPHAQDEFLVDFGNKAWRVFNYRFCISTRQGRGVCEWALKKVNTRSTAIKEFQKYLAEVWYKL